MPKQCRIGLDSVKQVKLNRCLENQNSYEPSNIISIELNINANNNTLQSIKQVNKYNGTTSIVIKETKRVDESLLIIDSVIYKDFEIIDLR